LYPEAASWNRLLAGLSAEDSLRIAFRGELQVGSLFLEKH